MAAEVPALGGMSFRAKGPSYIATIAVGHGIKHWYVAAFAVFLPLIEREYGLTAVGVGVLVTIRQVGGGLPNFFVGYITDQLRRHWNLLLPISLVVTAACYMLAGLTHWYWPVVLLIAFAGVAASFWHPAAISMLSTRFPERRGMAIAFHGAGSGAGEALGPVGVGFILAVFLADEWRVYVLWSFIPAVALAVVLYWFLSATPPAERPEGHPAAKVLDIFKLLRYPALRNLAYMNFTRSFAHFGLLAFLPLYLANDLEMDSRGVGFHIALLTFAGVAVGPAFGYISDRIGRRIPIVTALVVIAVGMNVMGVVGSGIPLAIALAFTGMFLWSVQDVTNAAAMDAAPPGTEGTVVGLMFASSFASGALAPMIMAGAVTLTGSNLSIFFVSGLSVVPAIVYFLFATITPEQKAVAQ